jgi:hypothetical protein
VASFGFFDECYKAVAVGSKNMTLCGKIQQAWVRDDCIIALRKTQADCDVVEDIAKKNKCLQGL